VRNGDATADAGRHDILALEDIGDDRFAVGDDAGGYEEVDQGLDDAAHVVRVDGERNGPLVQNFRQIHQEWLTRLGSSAPAGGLGANRPGPAARSAPRPERLHEHSIA
jgi:hypothetical protein